MLRNLKRFEFVGLLVSVTLLLANCGGSGSSGGTTGGSSDSMSAAQADALAKSMSLAATSSMSSSSFKEVASSDTMLPTEVQKPNPLWKAVNSVTCSQTSCMINQPIAATRTCTSGGSMIVSGNISGSINNTGTGLVLIDATGTITDWSCLPPLIINGDPYISLSGQFSFLNGVPSTQQHISINGGVKWGTTAAQSCQVHLDTNFNRTGGGSTTGTVCGHTVNVTF